MTRYIIQRLGQACLVIIGIALVVFFMVRLTGDPARTMLPQEASAAEVAAFREAMGFNRPLLVQFADFVWKAIHGDLGRSLHYDEPALPLVLERLPATIELALAALGWAVLVGVSLGLLAAVRQSSVWDVLARTLALLGQATPGFWLGLILIIVFAVQLRLLPTGGRGGPESLILPALTLGIGTFSRVTRLARSSMLEVLRQDYIRVAHAKGLPVRLVYLRHALKNAAIPLVTLIGIELGYMLSGAVLTETVFAWPGMGRLAVNAIGQRDFPLVQAVALFTAFVVVVLSIVTDLLYALLNPRIRFGER